MDPGELSPKQRRAIAALISERSTIAAAEAAKVGERTLRRWLADPGFNAALAKAEAELIDKAGRQLLAGQERALSELYQVMTTADRPGDRLRAAMAWLDYALQYRAQAATEARLAEIEIAIFGKVTE
jgi:uncharacterized coiled-coil protein SlyX